MIDRRDAEAGRENGKPTTVGGTSSRRMGSDVGGKRFNFPSLLRRSQIGSRV